MEEPLTAPAPTVVTETVVMRDRDGGTVAPGILLTVLAAACAVAGYALAKRGR